MDKKFELQLMLLGAVEDKPTPITKSPAYILGDTEKYHLRILCLPDYVSIKCKQGNGMYPKTTTVRHVYRVPHYTKDKKLLDKTLKRSVKWMEKMNKTLVNKPS